MMETGKYLTSGKVSSARWWWAEESTVGFVTLNVYNICCSGVDDICGGSVFSGGLDNIYCSGVVVIFDNICGDSVYSGGQYLW